MAEHWRTAVARAFEVLDGALERSPLPDEPTNAPELEAWLVNAAAESPALIWWIPSARGETRSPWCHPAVFLRVRRLRRSPENTQ
jgi:hypothetical protein